MHPAEPSQPRKKACGAKKRNGEPCRTPAMPNGRCRMHGGMSTGPKTWTAGGRYSKKLAALRELLAGRAADPEFLDVRKKLALLDEAEDRVLARGLEEGDTPEFRTRCLELWKAASQAAMDGADWQVPFGELGDVIRRGVREDEVLVEATKLAERRINKTVDLRHVMVREDQALSVQQAEAFVAMIFGFLRERLPPDVAPRIVYDLQCLIQRGPAQELAWLVKDVQAVEVVPP